MMHRVRATVEALSVDAVSVEVFDGGVLLRCRDGDVELHPLWLRERSAAPGTTDAVTGQRLFEPRDITDDLAVRSASLDAEQELVVTFNDGHAMRLPLSAVSTSQLDDVPDAVAWRAADIEVPLIDYGRLASSEPAESLESREAALRAFFEFGFFVLRGTPAVPGALHEITSHFGRISPTNFGVLFDVRTEPVAVDLAYTPVALSAHSDQPYRSPTPGLQFLHTIANDAPGGASTMVDGLAAVDDLATADPEAHDLLCSLNVEFRYDIGDDVKVDRAPIIERYPDRSFRQLRFSPRLDFAPMVDRCSLDVYYRGRRWLAEALNHPSRQLEFRMEAGDTLVVDNHRVLHGRASFDPTRGHRHLQGCYIDHDGPMTEWILAKRQRRRRHLGLVARQGDDR